MRRILFDSNAYVAFKRGDKAALEIVRIADQITLSSVVLGELLAGFAGGAQEERNRIELTEFIDSSRVTVVPVTEQTSEHYGVVYKGLRRKGRPIPANDLWIAATALEHGCSIFTFDKHFDEIDNLWLGHEPEHFLP